MIPLYLDIQSSIESDMLETQVKGLWEQLALLPKPSFSCYEPEYVAVVVCLGNCDNSHTEVEMGGVAIHIFLGCSWRGFCFALAHELAHARWTPTQSIIKIEVKRSPIHDLWVYEKFADLVAYGLVGVSRQEYNRIVKGEQNV